MQLADTRLCRPAGCSPTCTFLESSRSQPGTVFAHPPPSCHSVAQTCPTLYDPIDYSMSALPVLHHLPGFAQTHVHRVVMLSSHLILCCPLLLLPSIFPNIRVFSNESALHIRWPKYWSFSISPSNEYSELISFRSDWFDLPAVRGTLKSSSISQFKSINSSALH